MKELDVKYFDGNMTKVKKVKKGDWIDLRCVGANEIITHNNIDLSTMDKPLLSRNKVKIPKKIEMGYFKDEEGNVLEVKFFRYRKGEYLMLDLGIGMKLPENHEAHVLPRGSSFKNFSFLQTNSQGIIDETYQGDNDRWFLPVLTMRDGFIIVDERVCQFRIMEKMDKDGLNINEVVRLGDVDRGGHGESGTK